MEELQTAINLLQQQHDEHMKATYEQFVRGEEVSEMWAYGAGLFHAIRTMQDTLEVLNDHTRGRRG